MFVRVRTVTPRKKKKGAHRLFATGAFVMSAALAGQTAHSQPAPAPTPARSADVQLAIPAAPRPFAMTNG